MLKAPRFLHDELRSFTKIEQGFQMKEAVQKAASTWNQKNGLFRSVEAADFDEMTIPRTDDHSFNEWSMEMMLCKEFLCQ